jgi:hypothetical protein
VWVISVLERYNKMKEKYTTVYYGSYANNILPMFLPIYYVDFNGYYYIELHKGCANVYFDNFTVTLKFEIHDDSRKLFALY